MMATTVYDLSACCCDVVCCDLSAPEFATATATVTINGVTFTFPLAVNGANGYTTDGAAAGMSCGRYACPSGGGAADLTLYLIVSCVADVYTLYFDVINETAFCSTDGARVVQWQELSTSPTVLSVSCSPFHLHWECYDNGSYNMTPSSTWCGITFLGAGNNYIVVDIVNP